MTADDQNDAQTEALNLAKIVERMEATAAWAATRNLNPADIFGATVETTLAMVARVRELEAQRERLHDEVARLMAGADEAQPAPNVWMTAGQLWQHLTSLPEAGRLERLGRMLEFAQDSERCFVQNHDDHLARAESAEAERDALQRRLTDAEEQIANVRDAIDEALMEQAGLLGPVVSVSALRAALGDPDAPPQEPHPTSEADEVQYEVAAQFQDGEVFTPEQMARGLGVFDDEAPVLVARRVGDDEWLTLGSGGGFIHEYEVWDDDGDESDARQQDEEAQG